MNKIDVPGPIDLRDPVDAREWERTAQLRPGREEISRAFCVELQATNGSAPDVLELGSGPGFLAAFLLEKLPHLRLTLLDFSAAMHDLAQIRLGEASNQVRFLELNFKDKDWSQRLGPFDAIISNQSVHELRHKRYATGLHKQVARVLKKGGLYLVCDHFFGEGGLTDDQLFMTIDEQRQALLNAGFMHVECVSQAGSLVLHRAA